MITKEKLLSPLVRIGITTLKPDGTYHNPIHIAPKHRWKNWRVCLKLHGIFYTFTNHHCNPKVPGRLLPFRWGFGIAGLIEIGDRGSRNVVFMGRKPK